VRIRRGACALLFAALILSAAAAFASESEGATGVWGSVGIDEHLGSFVPREAQFRLEDGSSVKLGDIMGRPTILALVYYRCPNACDYLLTGMADGFRLLDAVPGKDYQVLTLTIDDRETPEDALKAKKIALESIMTPFPPTAWHFLTGAKKDIDAVAGAIGFRYVRDGDDFDHPLGLVILSAQGKIVRYMTGTDFLPVDLKMSLMEASNGTIGPTIAKVLRLCFTYDPNNRKLVFSTLKVTAIVTLTVAAALVLYLLIAGRRRKAAGRT
jgi:protein SCO1